MYHVFAAELRPSARIALSSPDVEEAFRQALVVPAGAAHVGYVFGDRAVIDLCLEFAWRRSLGF